MSRREHYDAIIIGSGFGGGAAAHALVGAGKRVLMLERGDWVPRGPHNWGPEGSLELTPFYSKETPYGLVRQDSGSGSGLSGFLTSRFQESGKGREIGSYYCVGGPSVFYGAVSLRLRERDFHADPEIAGDSGAEWPFSYAEIEPWYVRAEQLLGVAGQSGGDPTEPPRSAGYPGTLSPLSGTSRRIASAAESLGMHPFRLPLAIHYGGNGDRTVCERCTTCDTFACAIEAKNDIATAILPGLMAQGMVLRPGTVATRLRAEGGRLTAVECVDRATGEPSTHSADTFLLAAGALGSAHLLLASGLEAHNPAGEHVGRYLTRHCNAIAFGLFAGKVDPVGEFHKQLGILDFYFGHPAAGGPRGKLGGIQQVQSPPAGLIRHYLPPGLGALLARLVVPRATGLLVMAEDQPRPENRLRLDPTGGTQRFGLPRAVIEHQHTDRDGAARAALLGQARKVLRRAGAMWVYEHLIDTFSHAAGTVRMGRDPRTSPLDEHARFRGVDNLFVVDASALPLGGGVNPSLTIAANALRVGAFLATS